MSNTEIKTTDYPVMIIRSERDQAFLAHVFDLPGCVADGSTPMEAFSNVQESIEEWLETARELNWDIPVPSEESQIKEQVRKNQELQKQRFAEAVNAQVRTFVEAVFAQGMLGRIPMPVSGWASIASPEYHTGYMPTGPRLGHREQQHV